MNLLLLVVDSLRGISLDPNSNRPLTPFLDELANSSCCFSRAYATECWTLPSHVSLFTGMLPSEHGAHFQTMEYRHPAPTLAELLSKEGFQTEAITRNPVLDGTIPGVLRGFQRLSAPMAPFLRRSPTPILLAVTKPRLRRQIRETGFFHPEQVANAKFAMEFARGMLPADQLALDLVLERLSDFRRTGDRFFIFCNLYDVHAPYFPAEHGIFDAPHSLRDLLDYPLVLSALGKIGRHEYLKLGFQMPSRAKDLLLRRYHRAIELMDKKLALFFASARALGLLDDTLVIVTGDHGEAFGDHDLYLHDGSLYEPNVRVPLWILHPQRTATSTDDVVSLRDLFSLMRHTTLGEARASILDEEFRQARPAAILEHFYYPRVPKIAPKYRQNQVGVVTKRRKFIARGMDVEVFDNSAMNEDSCSRVQLDRLAQSDLGIGPAAGDAALRHARWFADRYSTTGGDIRVS